MGNGPRRISLLRSAEEVAAGKGGVFRECVPVPPDFRMAAVQIECLAHRGGELDLTLYTSADRKMWSAVLGPFRVSGPEFQWAPPAQPHLNFVRLKPARSEEVELSLGAWLVEGPT